MADLVAVQRRVLTVAAATQVLGGVGMATAIAASALITTRLSGSEAIGGMAVTATVIGAAAAAVVLARIAGLRGRRPALTLGYGIGALGGAGAVVAVAVGSTVLLLVALLLVGAASSAGLSARFGATDLAAPERRASALSLVVWATTIGAVAGPNLAAPVQDLAAAAGLDPGTGPYVLCTAAFGLAALVAWLGLRPDPLLLARATQTPDGAQPVARPQDARSALLASPRAMLGIGGVALGHLLMVGLMSMTPVHMDHGGASLAVVGFVISLHVAGMYALSPVFGWLADRLGRVPILAVSGLVLVAAALCAAAAAPADTALLTVGLVLLGLGWSGALVAGSALLSESVPLPVRPGVQGIADVTMNLAGAVGGILAGLVFAGASYAALGLAAAVLVAPYLAVVLVIGRRPATAT